MQEKQVWAYQEGITQLLINDTRKSELNISSTQFR
jgi:hypothetical protein